MRIQGVVVPIVTPFDSQGRIDTVSVSRLVEGLISRGVSALLPGGTTGEGPLLTTPERRELAEAVVKATKSRIPVIVHTGAITTDEALELTLHAQAIGAQAAALIPPFYYRHSQDALFRHFEVIARQVSGFPIYLYNNPAVTGNPLSIELIRRLAANCSNIVGIKDSSGGLAILSACTRLRDGKFNTANGSDGMILASLASGVDACVSGNANVVPELVVAIHRAWTDSKLETARELQIKLDSVRELLFDGGDLSLFKGVLAKRGLNVGRVRRPLVHASDETLSRCWESLQDLGLDLSPL